MSQASSRFSSMIEDKLQSSKRVLSEDSASSLESAFKRLKKLSHIHKNEGSKRQYEHKEKVLESFSQSQDDLASDSEDEKHI